MNGPTAVLKSVARVDSALGSNGTLLNLKFSPEMFADLRGLKAFSQFLRGFVRLKISHVQFNVLNEADLRAARENPDQYRNLTVRVPDTPRTTPSWPLISRKRSLRARLMPCRHDHRLGV